MWHTHTVEYYSALKKKKKGNPAIWDNMDEPRGHHLSEISQQMTKTGGGPDLAHRK